MIILIVRWAAVPIVVRSEAEQLLLLVPSDRQIETAGQLLRGQINRLASGEDRIGDAGREEGERKEAADVLDASTELIGDFSAASSATV